ncbi:hypothetical protein [Streptomyces sp. NPDC046197]|uniref:hypothetical protein n=1 Tax=Streptomyces sp. NPDC046197 TaxID=3154337 RepID=UPI0033CE85D3
MHHPRVTSARFTTGMARGLSTIPLVVGLASVANPTAAYAVTSVQCDTGALNTAIAQANANGQGTIQLAPRCIYSFATAVSGQDATPPITVPITFVGNGATLLRDTTATGLFRLLDVAVGGTATIRDLTIENGNVTGNGGGVLVQTGGTLNARSLTVKKNHAGGDGGGIDDQGTLGLTDSRVTDNTVAGFGGGIAVQTGGTASVNTTTVSGNTANSFAGGGVVNDGSITISSSSITRNHVATGDGGGLWNDAQMTVNDSTIANNIARDHGAGVTNAGGGSATFNRSTIEKNSAGLQAGGIYNVNPGSTLVLNVSHVTRNTAGSPPGGVFNGPGSVVVNKHSVILANTPTNCTGSPSPVAGCTN